MFLCESIYFLPDIANEDRQSRAGGKVLPNRRQAAVVQRTIQQEDTRTREPDPSLLFCFDHQSISFAIFLIFYQTFIFKLV